VLELVQLPLEGLLLQHHLLPKLIQLCVEVFFKLVRDLFDYAGVVNSFVVHLRHWLFDVNILLHWLHWGFAVQLYRHLRCLHEQVLLHLD
jgi:hypothetical protein